MSNNRPFTLRVNGLVSGLAGGFGRTVWIEIISTFNLELCYFPCPGVEPIVALWGGSPRGRARGGMGAPIAEATLKSGGRRKTRRVCGPFLFLGRTRLPVAPQAWKRLPVVDAQPGVFV